MTKDDKDYHRKRGAEIVAQIQAAREKQEQDMTDKPSGSFVLWQNTLCNPLADPISMTHSAWHDGYASGVKAEREAMVDEAAKQGWAMRNEDPFEDAVRKIAAIRSRT